MRKPLSARITSSWCFSVWCIHLLSSNVRVIQLHTVWCLSHEIEISADIETKGQISADIGILSTNLEVFTHSLSHDLICFVMVQGGHDELPS